MPEHAHAEEQKTDLGETAAWFLAGTMVGVMLGVLFAPRSGRETRGAIAGTSRDLYDRGVDYYEKGREMMDDAADLFERGKKLASGEIE